MKRLTERQEEVWHFIRDFTEDNRRPPTYNELADICRGRDNVSYYTAILENKGYIIRPGSGYTGMMVRGLEKFGDITPICPADCAKRDEASKEDTEETNIAPSTTTLHISPMLMKILSYITVSIATVGFALLIAIALSASATI